jgi:hypothetical protein
MKSMLMGKPPSSAASALILHHESSESSRVASQAKKLTQLKKSEDYVA